MYLTGRMKNKTTCTLIVCPLPNPIQNNGKCLYNPEFTINGPEVEFQEIHNKIKRLPQN